MEETLQFMPEFEEVQSRTYHRIIGASVIGPLHVIKDMPCQDACAFKTLPDDFGIIAVADGLGSVLKSEIGASSAVNAAVKKVEDIVTGKNVSDIYLSEVAKEAVFFARKALEEKSIELQCELRELACTLIVVVIHKNSIIVGHIGDGAVIAKTNDCLKLISSPDESSEYANEVSPITGKDWEQVLRISPQTTDVLGVMVFTDGCQRAALRKTQDGLLPFDGFCGTLFSYMKEVKNLKEAEEDIKGLLLSKKVCENSDDDKTLVIACLNDQGQRSTL